jgi:hypothetical protein
LGSTRLRTDCTFGRASIDFSRAAMSDIPCAFVKADEEPPGSLTRTVIGIS